MNSMIGGVFNTSTTLVIESCDANNFAAGWCALDSPMHTSPLTLRLTKVDQPGHHFSTGLPRPDLNGHQGFSTQFPDWVELADLVSGKIQVTVVSHPESVVSIYVIGPARATFNERSEGCPLTDPSRDPPIHHAVLVLAHSKPHVLREALLVYGRLGWDVFVHLDAKVGIDDYVQQLGHLAEVATFLGERHEVYWCGYSMVEATLALIQAARASSVRYTRMSLVSDDTLPIWNDKKLLEWAATPKTWIQMSPQKPGDLAWQRYIGFYYWDHPTTARRREQHNPQVDEKMIMEIKELATLKKAGKKNVALFGGSQWWSMTNIRIEQVITDLSNDYHLQQSFKYSEVPDESIFQTLIAGSARHCGDITNCSPCFVDWKGPPYPRVFQRIGELHDEAFKQPFARKFL